MRSSDIEEALLSLPDGDLYVRQDGPRDAPALLLIHGFASSSRSWDPLLELLTGSHRVIRIDLLGHGRSAKPEHQGYGIVEHADRAAAVLDRLGVPEVVAVGHSTGGSVVTALAERRPDLVTALALLNSGPHLGAFVAQEFSFDPEAWPQITDEQIVQAMRPAFSRPGFRIPPELVADVRGMTFHSFAATEQGATGYLRERALPNRLTTVGKPLLVIFGIDDQRWRSSSAQDYRVVPGARIELVPGVGHSPMMEDPPSTAEPLLSFVAGVTARPTGSASG